MLYRLIKTYIIVFILFYLIYSSINWYLNIYGIYRLSGVFIFILPGLIGLILSFLIFKPIVKLLRYKFYKTSNFILWFIIPFSLGLSVSFSQDYFINSHYKLIHISKPSEIFNHKNERFFKIDKYFINKFNYYYIYYDSQNKGDLHVNSYFILPIYDDSTNTTLSTNIGCGQKIVNITHFGWFDKEPKNAVIEKLVKINVNDFKKTDFYSDGYFELVTNTDDLECYLEGWNHHHYLTKLCEPTIIEKKSGTFIDRLNRDFKKALLGTSISFIIAIILLIISHYFKKLKPDENQI